MTLKKKKRIGLYISLWLLWVVFMGGTSASAASHVILDTDLSSDVDDAGAVAVLHALANQGKVQILAMMVSSGDPWSGPCLDALNTAFGRSDIPVGVIKDRAVTHVSRYTQFLAEHYPHDFPAEVDKQEDAVRLYRKVLASQPSGSVTVVSIGYLSNLSRLLESVPDASSSLAGKELVRDKVKRLICMGGQFPSGREWNLYQDATAADTVASRWPTPVIFTGFEIGNTILTGKALEKVAENHPLREAYRRYNGLSNRQSWDQASVLLAANPDDPLSDDLISGYLDISEEGRVTVARDGSNSWESRKDGQHRFIRSTTKTKDLAGVIDDLMLEAASIFSGRVTK